MPLVRVNDKLVYFAHVPKCGGTSIESYLTSRFGPVALLDTDHLTVPEGMRWSRTSPQHIDRDVIARLFPEGFLDVSFAVVRHPVTRLASAYRWHRDVLHSIPPDVGLGAWVQGLDDDVEDNPYAYDNHPRRMTDLVPSTARVFRLEEGLQRIIEWFDELEGAARPPRSVPRRNAAKGQISSLAGPDEIALIAERYADDFERFGYDPNQSRPVKPVDVPGPGLVKRVRQVFRDMW